MADDSYVTTEELYGTAKSLIDFATSGVQQSGGSDYVYRAACTNLAMATFKLMYVIYDSLGKTRRVTFDMYPLLRGVHECCKETWFVTLVHNCRRINAWASCESSPKYQDGEYDLMLLNVNEMMKFISKYNVFM